MHIRLTSAAVALLATSLFAVQAFAAGPTYVEDGAGMFNADAISRVNAVDEQLVRRTGKAVTVITVKRTGGVAAQDAAAREAKARGLNGAIIYITRDDKQISIEYGAKTGELFSPALQTSIKQALRAAFRAGDYDNGIVTAVSAVADVIEGGASGGHGPAPQQVNAAQQRWANGGTDMSWIWWIIGFIVVILVVRALLVRRGGPPPATYPPGAAQPGQPGYPGNPPQSSGGSGFVPGLLGGVAGGFIGSELANAGRRDDAAASAAPREPSADASSSDAGGGFTDSGGSGNFGGGGGDAGGGW